MDKFLIKFLILVTLTSGIIHGARKLPEEGLFSGRVSKIHPDSGLVRIKVQFSNQKYVNVGDQIEFLRGETKQNNCKGYVKGKTSEYILIRIPGFKECRNVIHLGNGAYLNFYSEDLVNNLKMGKELFKILMKKYMAITSRMRRTKRELEAYIEKINAVNKRFQVLREKLEQEWRTEIQNLEDDQARTLEEYKELQVKVDAINLKVEQYRVDMDNLNQDRWSLDPSQYYRK